MSSPDLLLIGLRSDFLAALAPLQTWVAQARARFPDLKLSNVYRVQPERTQNDWLSELWAVAGVPADFDVHELEAVLFSLGQGVSVEMTPLLWGDRVMLQPQLPIPHPDLHRNLVFLQCACEVDASIRHPILGQSLGERLHQEKRLTPLEFFAQGRHLFEPRLKAQESP
ncbi:MAG: hypothetical protein KF767_15530 [Bdellovibrionaceae bacterium]|nr:hypothetical protein [Pseudobdellovibrionaceae bacterium]